MSPYEQVLSHAEEDAQDHQREFPGQPIIGDWDAEAWQIARSQMWLSDREADALWPVYQKALHAAVETLRTSVSSSVRPGKFLSHGFGWAGLGGLLATTGAATH